MRIGIVDQFFIALQNRLLKEGHELFIYAGAPSWDIAFQSGPLTPDELSRVHFLDSFEDLLQTGCDFYITQAPDPLNSYEILKGLERKVLGHGVAAFALEACREFGRQVIATHCPEIHIPASTLVSRRDDLHRQVSRNLPCVVKQSSNSPLAVVSNRTMVCHDQSALTGLNRFASSWFSEDGLGGAVVESFMPGQEVCWGAYFNGSTFQWPLYSCIEHKGAQNGDRGGILTGEVGTTIKLHHPTGKSVIGRVFRQLEPFLSGKMHGMFDINTMLDLETGSLGLIEMTVRFGRPTLEVLLAMLTTGTLIGAALFEIASGKEWTSPYRDFDHAVGVSVFPYGYPLKGDRSATYIPAFPQESLGSIPVPVYSMWDAEKKLWVGDDGVIPFVQVGLGDGFDEAVENAYAPLDGYRLWGHTWRDDVGKNLPALYEALERFSIVD